MKNIVSAILLLICSLSALSLSFFASADEITFAPIMGVSHNNIDLSSKNIGSDSTTVQTYKLGLLTQVDKWTLKWTVDLPISDSELDVNPVIGAYDFEYSSRDISLSYRVNNDISVFAGYLNNKFQFTNTNVFAAANINGDFEQNYDELGAYIGGNYQYRLGNGALNFSVAYAHLDSSITDNMYKISPIKTFADGNTKGLSYNFSYQGSITESWKYTIGLHIRRYEFDSEVKTAVPEFPGIGVVTKDVFDSNWDMNTLSASFIYII